MKYKIVYWPLVAANIGMLLTEVQVDHTSRAREKDMALWPH